jgi:PTS system mannose-specific IIC component
MVELRRLNGRWARERLDRLEAGERGVAIGLQLGGIAADLLRGGLLTFVALLVLQPLARRVLLAWSVDVRISRAVVAGAALTVAAGAVWRLFHAVPGARWLFLGGLGVGLAFLALA